MEMVPDKSAVIQNLIERLEKELALLVESAKAAHEAATHEEAKSEDKHDTRATEASYLARGQAARVAEIERMVLEYKGYAEQAHRTMDRIQPGAIVVLQAVGLPSDDCPSGDKTTTWFFAQSGGGTALSASPGFSSAITVITPQSPLGEALAGLVAGDTAELETPAGVKEYLIKEVR